MKALDRKLFRDLYGLRGQGLAIAIVIGSGIATFIMSLSTVDSLRLTRDGYYQDYRFAEVFATLKRAPESLHARIAAIPGVMQVDTRVIAPVNLDIADYPEPVNGHLISVEDSPTAVLNRLHLRAGRRVETDRADEVMLSEPFAQAHDLQPGDTLAAIINGRRETLTIVGIVLSPEYIYQIAPGAVLPDFKHFGVLWMSRRSLATAYNMEGAFNDVSLTLSGQAHADDVIDHLDTLLQPYGGLGAYTRHDHVSHRFLSEEIHQLGEQASISSLVFLGVAAFLLNVVVSRLITTQREQIATLKAFGYANITIALHYLKLVLVIVAFGIVLGVLLGVWLGQELSELYMYYYRFPFLLYQLRFELVVQASLVTAAAAILGTLQSLRRAALLPPAEAMRPEAPASYRVSVLERLGLKHLLSQPSRMIIRHLLRKPIKALLSITGIAMACATLMASTFFLDALDFSVNIEFALAQREDLSVTFTDPTSRRAVYDLRALPGVDYVEPYREAPVRLRFEHRSYRTSIHGFEPDAELRRTLDTNLLAIEPPPAGVIMTQHLATLLGVNPGDKVTLEILEGQRVERQVPIVGLINQYIGLGVYMELSALNRLMQEGQAISGAYMAADSHYLPVIYKHLKAMPRIAGTEVHQNKVENFHATIGEFMLTYVTFISVLAAIITFGVIYNSARIALSERSRELASLRVLGFTRGEIAYILLGELALLTLAAIPLGFIIGQNLCAYFTASLENDLYRIPLIIAPRTYALAATVVLVSAILSALLVQRKLNRLDLVEVLKTRE